MTTLFLQKEDANEWTQVYFDGSQSFKLTRENPYFTKAESYTYDLTLPMDITQNRTFFQSMHRIDRTKSQMLLKSRLMVDRKTVLDGTAKITQVTRLAVKVQLLGGRSEINILSTENMTYIDDLLLGRNVGERWGGWRDYMERPMDDGDIAFLPVYDETRGRFMNMQGYRADTGSWYDVTDERNRTALRKAVQPRLLYVLKAIVEQTGYTLDRCDFDCEPWNRLFIASAKSTNFIAKALPHWLVRDFLNEICSFFNCTLIVDQEGKTVSFVSNKEFFDNGDVVTLEPIEEYFSEMNEDSTTSSLATDNVEFDMSASDAHLYDILTEERREGIPARECASKEAAALLYESLGQDERLCYVYRCPTGLFAGWKKGEESPELTRIDHFAPLMRNKQGDSTNVLKICPVALTETTEALFYGTPRAHETHMTCIAASLENPTGDWFDEAEEMPTAQELIEGDAELQDKPQKEDRLQVMFVDDRPQHTEVIEGDDKGYATTHPMPFTDCNYLAQQETPHRSWSLSLNTTDATYYLGQLHHTPFSFNIKAKHTFRFLSAQMPDPASIFLIRGHRYACEKIEASVNAEGFDRLMTGYFYEIL